MCEKEDILFSKEGIVMAYELNNSFSVCFNMMKIRYIDYDQTFDEIGLIGPNDSVNVFINLESVLNFITTIKDLDKKLVSETQFPQIMVSDILNLAAHYKKFFRGNKLPTKVFLYMTSLESDSFKEMRFNEDYRSYYLNKFNTNPRFSALTDYLLQEILPESEQICQFIPNIYLINAKNVDSSVIPEIIATLYPESKNVIVTADYFDTQYCFKKNFVVHYLRRSPLHSSITYNLKGYLKEIIKRDADQETEVNILNNLSKYICLLSVIGDKSRSIDPIKRIGAISVMKYLRSGVDSKVIGYDTTSVELLKEAFPSDMQEDLVDNFNQYSIDWKKDNISEDEIYTIKSMIVDRFDNNSLMRLNSSRFYEHPLMLEELTM